MFQPFYIERDGRKYLVIAEKLAMDLITNEIFAIPFRSIDNGGNAYTPCKFVGFAKVSDFEVSLDSDKLTKKQ